MSTPADDPVWSQLKLLPSAGDAPDLIPYVNDCTARLKPVGRLRHETTQCIANNFTGVSSAKRRRVFDMFLINGEIDLMEARLAELNEYVDVFVVVEASKTHQGLRKSSVLKDHWKTRFSRFSAKLIHVWVDVQRFDCKFWPWVCENYQREKMLDGFLRANGRDEDVVITSDLDEFPRAATVSMLRWCDLDGGSRPTRLKLAGDHFWYSAHCRRVRQWDLGPVVVSGRSLRRWGAHQIRGPYSAWGSIEGPPKVDRGWTRARGWSDLSQALPTGPVRTEAQRDYQNGTLTTRAFMPHIERANPAFHAALAQLELLDEVGMQTLVATKSSWHFSYFMSPQQIQLKYRSANVGSKFRHNVPSTYYRLAMKCRAPQHAKWVFEYVDTITESEVPRFVLLNRCRMRVFYGYSHHPGAWLSNDYAPNMKLAKGK